MSETIHTLPHNLFAVPDIVTERAADSLTGNIGNPNAHMLLYPHHSPIDAHALAAVALALVTPRGKGIYATDEAPDAMAAVLDAALGQGNGAVKSREKRKWTEEEERERRVKWREVSYGAVPSGTFVPQRFRDRTRRYAHALITRRCNIPNLHQHYAQNTSPA